MLQFDELTCLSLDVNPRPRFWVTFACREDSPSNRTLPEEQKESSE